MRTDNRTYVKENSLVLYDAGAREWLLFSNPLRIFSAHDIPSIEGIFHEVEEDIRLNGLYAAGFVSYEAGPAFDPAFVTHCPGEFPLVWFGIYREPVWVEASAIFSTSADRSDLVWEPSISEYDYSQGFQKIKNWIADGDTYQVNYSFRLRTPFSEDPWELFTGLIRAQGTGYGAFVNTDDWAICSASPELFFSREGYNLVSKPMKGTARRGVTCEDDRRQADLLASSEKNRAENVMIVDMVRNDMGRICDNNGVAVPVAFDIEKLPTLLQMTSTVRCQTNAGLLDIFRALFPAASITGAPKVRTMQIIAELETTPRKIYTGAIGFFSPDNRAQFNVAIRTVLVDKTAGIAEYGIGGGIVWDSENRDELAECHAKAKVLFESALDFELLESILWTPAGGYCLIEEHMNRLIESAAFFSRLVDPKAVAAGLAEFAQGLPPRAQKVRLLISGDGGIKIEADDLRDLPTPYRIGLAVSPVNRKDPFLYHKTTRRALYDSAIRNCPGYDDVLLWNEKGELTESCRANLFIEKDGILWTPPAACGLLAGTFRSFLLSKGQVREAVLSAGSLKSSSRIYLGNAVRGLWEVFPDL